MAIPGGISGSLGNNVGRPNASGWTPPSVSVKRTIHLMQVSLERTDSLNEMAHDMRYAFSQEPDVIGFTEMVGGSMRSRFNVVCRENDYVPIVPTGTGLTVPLAVRLGGPGDTKVKDKGAKLALNGVAGKYENRYISWVQIRWHNQNIFVHEGHWSRTKHGTERHTDVTQMMAAQVKKHGKNDAISFWMGDLNVDDNETVDARATHVAAATNLNNIFREAGLLSVFDELHANPPMTLAGHGTYDVIGSYRPDKQVEGKRYKVHPRQKSDHRPVSAWFEIETGRRASVQPVGNIGDTDSAAAEDLDPDFYATGGNIDWSDYLNNDLYPLPFAYGDSDSHRHG